MRYFGSMRCIDDIHLNQETGLRSTTYFTCYSQNRWAFCTVVVQVVVLLNVLRILAMQDFSEFCQYTPPTDQMIHNRILSKVYTSSECPCLGLHS